MAEPSEYERDQWQKLQRFKGRPLSRAVRNAGEQVAVGAAHVGKRATKYLENHERAKSVVSRGQEVVAKGAHKVGATARGAADALPDWGGAALQSARKTVGKVARAGLSAERVIAKHNKRGHEVDSLLGLRRLDLEQIDAVRGRRASWYYPAGAALSGAGAGLVITGGQFAVAVSAGAAAAPSGGAIVGAVTADAAVVLGLASRSVGQVALFYGYDPEEPAEKLFVMTVVNAGTASSATAKTAAMADISRLTQALIRNKTWEVLNESVVSKVYNEFAKAFSFRLTKKGLGKAVPAIGILVGGAFNWATLEGIVDAADVAYRRRFLLEKYPQLGEEGAAGPFPDADPEDGPDGQNGPDSADGEQDAASPEAADEPISLLDELADAGGPDLR